MDLKKQHWKYHLLLAVVILIMDFFGDYVYKGMEGFMENFKLSFAYSKIMFYVSFYTIYVINYFIVCPKTLSKKRIGSYVVSILILFFGFAFIRFLLEEVILFQLTGNHNYYEAGRNFLYYTFDNTYFALKAILFSTALYLFFEYIENQDRINQLQLEHKKAELSFLKSQLEPHFLFNTLNSFYTDLVDTQPKAAKDIHRLSELLRYVTYEAQQDFMPLNKEVKFIEDYIYFYRKRFENYLFLEYNIEGIVADQKMPSLVLIHFIENIFKHGVTNKKETPAKIVIQITNNDISITTENKVSSSEKYSNKGIGKENLVRRLKAIYKDDYELNFNEENQTFKAFLKIPFNK
ncbi:histidine kinase [Polaribacter sp. ALD11]|uniref:sensor histidine kinase n=1 Tax=Polaribacter sp. ALD11 TaxID=2058137 RepID=UPI000C3008DE|nr:histidine kinase [Polaribacter sp. ALD11]AUC86114.1 histidine kinase [Polaribacter sp. ALD11]